MSAHQAGAGASSMGYGGTQHSQGGLCDVFFISPAASALSAVVAWVDAGAGGQGGDGQQADLLRAQDQFRAGAAIAGAGGGVRAGPMDLESFGVPGGLDAEATAIAAQRAEVEDAMAVGLGLHVDLLAAHRQAGAVEGD